MTTTDAERRSLARPVTTRADGGKMTVGGYAAVFGEAADIGGYFREIIAPGAFANTLKSADVRAYFDHDSGRVLGRSSAGTLRLKEDAKGLAVEIDLPDTSDGNDVRTLIERGDVSGMSFGFMVTKQTWDETGEVPVRTIEELDLREVSIVSEPAYDGTSIALRSLDSIRKRKNFNAAASRLRMKTTLDLQTRSGSKA
jgi:HK97 family phage prohead protease